MRSMEGSQSVSWCMPISIYICVCAVCVFVCHFFHESVGVQLSL